MKQNVTMAYTIDLLVVCAHIELGSAQNDVQRDQMSAEKKHLNNVNEFLQAVGC